MGRDADLGRTVTGTVDFPVGPEVAFDYLADPRHRAEWQSSLRRVEDIVGPVAVGQTWTDVTVPGLRPAMRTTELERPRRWSEVGTWRGVRAGLSLTFAATATGCRVSFAFRITGPGPLAPLGLAMSLLSRPAVGSDLRRAAHLLGTRG